MRRASVLPIAVMAFAIVAFLFVVTYAVTPGLKYPWSTNSVGSGVTTSVTNSNTFTTNSVTNTSTTASAPISSGWHYYPNYQDVRGVEQVGDTRWVATYGGLLKFNVTTKQYTWFTVKDGLASNLLTSLVYDPATKYLWIGHQNASAGNKGGVTRFNTVTGVVEKFYHNPADDTDIFRQYFPPTYEGLISGANVVLKRDTYTGDIWAATFRGVSRYVADGDTWESNGSGDSIDFAGVRDIGFTPTAVWIFVTPNAYTKGGMLRLDRTTKQWSAQNETSNLNLDRDDIGFTTVEADVWAVGRPNDWVSAEKSRDADVYRYRAATGTWQKITEVNGTLLATDHVSAVTTVDGQVVLTVTRKDRSLVEMVINPTTLAVTVQAVAPTFVEQYGAYMGYPSVMDVLYATSTGGLMTSSGTMFDTTTGQQDVDVTLAIKALAKKEPNVAGLQPIVCNQWNDATQDVLLQDNNEYMGGSFGLYIYRRSTKTVERVLSAKDWDTSVLGSNPLTCLRNTVVVLDKTGASEYDINENTMKKIGTGFVDFREFLGSNGRQAYFTAADNRLGMYDIASQAFTYVNFRLPSGLTADALRFYTVTARGVWFTSALSGDSTKPVNVAYVFNPTNGAWTTYSLRQQFVSGEQINTIRAVGDDVWLFSSINPYVLRSGSDGFVLADAPFRAEMMSDDVRMVFDTPNGVWFANGFGLWGKVD